METQASYQAFLKQRRGIGSSEIGAICGYNRWMTPLDVWLVKTGRRESFQGNDYTRAGTKLEKIVAEYFTEETGFMVQDPGMVTLYHKELPMVSASPDRYYTSGNKMGILECKTTQATIDKEMLPKSWFCQLQYQLAIANQEAEKYPFGAVAWLERGLKFKYQFFDYNAEFGAQLLEFAEDWWNSYVETDEPPEPVHGEDVVTLFPQHTSGKEVQATEETVRAWERLTEINEQIQALQRAKEEVSDQLKVIMKDAEALVYQGETLVTWKASKASKRLDQKRLKAEAPEVWQKYAKEVSGSRRFLVK